MEDLFGPVIFSYTREQAVADGQQIKFDGELAALAAEAGWKFQVYMTDTVWNLVEMAVANKKHMNDLKGVLWDIFYMGAHGPAKMLDASTKQFQVIITGTGRTRNHWLKVQVGPTDIDDATPAVTFMMADED